MGSLQNAASARTRQEKACVVVFDHGRLRGGLRGSGQARCFEAARDCEGDSRLRMQGTMRSIRIVRTGQRIDRFITTLSAGVIGISLVLIVLACVVPTALRMGYNFLVDPIYVTRLETHLGSIPLGRPTHYRIAYVNNHFTPLRISRITTSCGCTVVNDFTSRLRPFQFGAVDIEVRPPMYGEAIRTVTIGTNRGSVDALLYYDAR